jgi:hypothetical protein
MTDGRARYTKLPALEKAEEEEDPAAAAADETRLRKAAVDEEWVPAPERAEDPDGMRTAERGGWKAAARPSLAWLICELPIASSVLAVRAFFLGLVGDSNECALVLLEPAVALVADPCVGTRFLAGTDT